MWSLEDVSERQVVKCPCLAASYCRLSELVDCGQLNPTELLRCSYLNLAIPTRMTMQKTVTVSGHCGQCHELYLATACPSACNSRSFRFDPSTVRSVISTSIVGKSIRASNGAWKILALQKIMYVCLVSGFQYFQFQWHLGGNVGTTHSLHSLRNSQKPA